MQHRSQRRTDLASFLIDEIGRDDPFTLLKRQDIQSAAAISGSDTYETVAAAAPVNNQSGIGLPRRRPTTERSVLMGIKQEIFGGTLRLTIRCGLASDDSKHIFVLLMNGIALGNKMDRGA